jgi:hypothetical protein
MTLAPAPEPAWVTIPLAEAVKVTAGTRLFVELQVSRGRLGWPECEADDVGAARLRRALPDDRFREFSAVPGVTTGAAPVRLVGEPRPDRPTPSLDVGVVDQLGTLRNVVSAGPDAGTTTLDVPLVPAVTGSVALSLVAYTPLTVTVGPIQVGVP